MDKDDGYSEKSNRGSSPQPPPSSLVSTPSFTRKQGEWNSAAPAYYESFYELHNPTGPRFYFNHHLAKKGVTRLPLMSPGFHTTSTTGSEKSNLSSPPIKTPDVSTLNLTQRTRKISTSDNVDLLDITDPWGQNFHHDSRYDVGIERKQEPVRFLSKVAELLTEVACSSDRHHHLLAPRVIVLHRRPYRNQHRLWT